MAASDHVTAAALAALRALLEEKPEDARDVLRKLHPHELAEVKRIGSELHMEAHQAYRYLRKTKGSVR